MTISRDTDLIVTPLLLGVLIRSNSKPDSYVKNIAQIRTFLHAAIINVFTRRSSYHKDDIRLVLLLLLLSQVGPTKNQGENES